MATKRKSIKVFPNERADLVRMYLERGIPIDQYEERPDELVELTDSWNALTGRTDSSEDLVHYMRTQRKRGKWVRFDGNHQQAPDHAPLTAEETEILVDIYEEHVAALANGSDVLAYDADIRELLAREFNMRARRVVPAHQLVGKLTALRKRGQLPKAAPFSEGATSEGKDVGFGDMGFSDINEVAG